MGEPKKLHLKRSEPEPVSPAAHGHAVISGGRRPVIPAEKRHGPTLAAAAPARGRRGPGKGVVFAIFGAILTAAIAFGIFKYLDEKRIEQNRERYALRLERDKAEALYAKFKPLIERVGAMQTAAEAAEAAAEEAVQFITGQTISAHTTPPQASRRPSAAASAKPDASAAVKPEAAALPPPRDERPPEREVVDGREQPEGVESIAELERRRQQEEEARQGVRRPPPGATPATPPAAEPKPPAPQPAAPEPEPAPRPGPGVDRGAPEVVRLAVDIKRLTDEIRGHGTAVETARGEAETVGNAVMRAPTSADAGRLTSQMLEWVTQAENAAGLAAAALDQVRASSVRIAALRDAEDQARKQREEEARRRQAEEDHKALVATEKAKADELHKGARPLIASYDFTQALAEMETALKAMQTNEGKAALGLVAERYRRLAAMKAMLIRNLNQRPFRWGWGTGAAAKDVRGADADSVDVVGGRVPWAEVSLPQMVKFVDHYQIDTTERLSVRADMALALAILLDETGKRAEAEEYVRRAREAGEHGQAEARRLLPDY